ncbi:hypothetical protein HOY82DRAFT_534895 [Tuber indicum]|nr:hypothetical protein HOY82DRAFT_534895 [Tuber indicum]
MNFKQPKLIDINVYCSLMISTLNPHMTMSFVPAIGRPLLARLNHIFRPRDRNNSRRPHDVYGHENPHHEKCRPVNDDLDVKSTHLFSTILAVPTHITATTTSALHIAPQRKLPDGFVVLLAFYDRNRTVNYLVDPISTGYKLSALSMVPDADISWMACARIPCNRIFPAVTRLASSTLGLIPDSICSPKPLSLNRTLTNTANRTAV